MTGKNWLITRQLNSSSLLHADAMPANSIKGFHGQATFYLDPPFSLTSTYLAYFASGLALEVTLADGSRAWILELRRPAHQYNRLYNVGNYPQRGLHRRDIIVLDASRSRLLLSASRYENLLTGTLRFATDKFLALAGVFLLIIVWPVGRELLRSQRTRRGFRSHRCIACGYPLAVQDHGVQPCSECGQLQWPADPSHV